MADTEDVEGRLATAESALVRYEEERAVLVTELARLEHELGNARTGADTWKKVAETWEARARAAGWRQKL